MPAVYKLCPLTQLQVPHREFYSLHLSLEKTLTFKSSRLEGRGAGLREEMQDCPEKVPFTGERGLLVAVGEELEVLAICSFDCLKRQKDRKVASF